MRKILPRCHITNIKFPLQSANIKEISVYLLSSLWVLQDHFLGFQDDFLGFLILNFVIKIM